MQQAKVIQLCLLTHSALYHMHGSSRASFCLSPSAVHEAASAEGDAVLRLV